MSRETVSHYWHSGAEMTLRLPLHLLIREFGIRDFFQITREPEAVLDLWTQYPVVLIHGFLSDEHAWDVVEKTNADEHWGFRMYSASFGKRALGFKSTDSPADQAIRVRNLIQDVIDATGAPKVNVVAHSKGGLVLRYLLAAADNDILGYRLDDGRHPADVIAKAITLDTPHRTWAGARHDDLLLTLGDLLTMAEAEWPEDPWKKELRKLHLEARDWQQFALYNAPGLRVQVDQDKNKALVALFEKYDSEAIKSVPEPVKTHVAERVSPTYSGNKAVWILYEAQHHSVLGSHSDVGALSFDAGLNNCSRKRYVKGTEHNGQSKPSMTNGPSLTLLKLDLYAWEEECWSNDRDVNGVDHYVVENGTLKFTGRGTAPADE